MAAVLIDRTNYNALVDDDGSNTVGTIFTKDKIKTVLLDQIDAMLATVFTSTTQLKSTVVTSSLTAVGVLASGSIASTFGAIASTTSVALTGTANNLGTITTGVWNAGAITTSGLITATATAQNGCGVAMSPGGVSKGGVTLSGYILGTSADDTAVWAQTGKACVMYSNGGVSSIFLSSAGAVTISALASGNLTSASGVITSSSDERMKDILGPLNYGLAEVLQLLPIRARWNALAHKLQGLPTDLEFGTFGAAQVEQSMPLAVAYGKDGMRSLNDRVILGGVVNAIKTINVRLRTCEARLN